MFLSTKIKKLKKKKTVKKINIEFIKNFKSSSKNNIKNKSKLKQRFIGSGYENKLFKDYNPKELDNHKRAQKIMSEMLFHFDRICRKYKLKYWCSGGTLIGAIRHKGWIPHDTDIDVCMLSNHYHKLKDIIQQELPKDIWFQTKENDPYFIIPTLSLSKIRSLKCVYEPCQDKQKFHNGLQIDIFILNKRNGYINVPFFNQPIGDIKRSRPKTDIFPLKELLFDNILVYVPNKYKQYSIDAWGDFPPKEVPEEQKYAHEGVINFNIPQWTKDKYPNLYPKK